MDEAEDLDLLRRWGEGDKAAGDTLVGRYFVIVRAYFLSKVPLDHEDLVQETFSRLLRKRDDFEGRSSFRVFVFGIAHMILLEHFRRRRRDQRFDPMESTSADLAGARASTFAAARQHHRLLFTALRSLVLREQELLELYYWQNLTAGEIAALHEVPEPTVRSRIRAALKRLATAFREQGEEARALATAEVDFEEWMKDIQGGLGDLRPEA